MKLTFSIRKLTANSMDATTKQALQSQSFTEKGVVQRRRNSLGKPISTANDQKDMTSSDHSRQLQQEGVLSETSWISFFSEEDTPAGRRAKCLVDYLHGDGH
ncbi:hypothetical protein GUITHDRAFT_118562 [Guillardia theta CCMP2712]|uniref:Uncharacterized protein n=1 Tax=Guillardia theta (strain CCMP2712) TaxID=905079 RepID=L1IG45_GUITC|nr:hypothetical protein GUITHDRAFT_118562 [Guillardia theta CCMP2712]EKX35218.1 hypothetical protein GUITHDRAFT_118562 [Guillardia theta CCMP2712]|eukprot:XP_005822198.1 hypothetical protein GUITHDRAFT_118562 [Guillardia theta CCMP2712]